MLLRALPGRDQVKHVLALGGLAIILALLACEFHRERLEDGFLEGLKKLSEENRGKDTRNATSRGNIVGHGR